MKTLRIRRKVEQSHETPKLKVYKIAKKIKQDNWKSPIPESIQEDFLLETSLTPDLFLQYSPSNTRLEVLSMSPVSESRTLLAPTSIVGPMNLYYKKANSISSPSLKASSKLHANFERGKSSRLPLVNFEEKVKSIKEGAKTERASEENELKKMTPGGRITFLKQTKPLEVYEKQRNYWKKLEENIADLVQKPPEELALNSAKEYERKKQEIEIIDRLQKSNEKRGLNVWKSSLRAELYSAPEPPLIITPGMFSTLKANSRYTKELVKYTKNYSSPKGLRTTDYFRGKLANYDKDTDEIMNLCRDELIVKGKDKLKMEYDAAKKVGIFRVIPTVSEQTEEEVIKENYKPSVRF
jgi:hypothetical protein